MIYQCEEYELDLELYQLRCAGALRKLEPKAFNVLCHLIQHRDRIVSKDELLAEFWDGQYISDAALNSCIMAARRAVGDNGNIQQVIQTQRGRGYRFIVEVTELYPELEGRGGMAAGMSCPSCTRQVPLPAAFCLHCGVALGDAGTAPVVPSWLEVPLVGREHEAARLQALLQEVRAGKGQVVDIVGEAGIGKSHLVEHFRQFSSFDGVTFVHVFCPPVRVGPPGEPIRNILRQCCGLSLDDDREAVGKRLAWWLLQLNIEPDEVVPYLLHMLACPVAGDRRMTQQPALLKVQVLMALRRVLVAYSQRQPLVIAVEDVQWLDQTSADCLAVLTPDISDLPVLLLVTRRPSASPVWYERGEVTSLPLQPLDEAERLRLLQAVFSTQAVEPQVELAMLARAAGHPGWLTQLARWCVDMREADDAVIGPDALPESLPGVIEARLACAPVATRQLLQITSVLGPAADRSVLERLWDGDRALDAVFQEAVLAGFYKVSHHSLDGMYRFSQAALQAGVYDHLPEAQRLRFHASVANALEKIYVEHQGQVSSLLAWYYVRAGQPEQAVPHWREAAREAARWGDYADALDLSQQMLAAIDSLSKRRQRQWRLECLLDQAR